MGQDALVRLERLIRDKKARIGIIGLGYVGLPLALSFCEKGFSVIGFDVDKARTEELNKGVSPIRHIASERIKKFTSGPSPLLTATADVSRISMMDCVIICVPTPLSDKREPDLSFVKEAGKAAAEHLKPGALVSLESTTYPGTTEEILLPLFAKRGLKPGADFFLAFSPEREDPGRKDFDTKTTPKIVGGVTKGCARAADMLYSAVVDKTVVVGSTKVAEMAKLLENIYRCVNIALVNEMKMLCDKMGIDIWEVIEASKTKPFGFQAFYPGPGLGGHCIPIDPFYLTWKAREYGFATRFIELAGEINTAMPHYVVSKVTDALNAEGKSVNGSRVLVLGLAYKKDVDDLRESPSLHIIRLLDSKGASVDYNDPYVPVLNGHLKGVKTRQVELDEKTVSAYDCVLIATDHGSYDYGWLVQKSRLVVDTRNATAGITEGRVYKA